MPDAPLSAPEVEQQICTALAEHHGLEQVLPIHTFEGDLDLDSLEVLQVFMHAEEVAGLEIEDAAREHIHTPRELAEYIVKKKG